MDTSNTSSSFSFSDVGEFFITWQCRIYSPIYFLPCISSKACTCLQQILFIFSRVSSSEVFGIYIYIYVYFIENKFWFTVYAEI